MAKLKVGLNHPKQTIQLNPLEIREMIIKRNKQESSQLVVDPTLSGKERLRYCSSFNVFGFS